MKRYVLGITGTTGSLLGIRLLESLIRESEVHLIISSVAVRILEDETGIDLSEDTEKRLTGMIKSPSQDEDIPFEGRLFTYSERDLWAPVSSGSFRTDGMFVVPCSMKTLSAIANGYADGLVERAADVTLKEGRPLVVAPRETPLSAIHLENMLKLARIGVRIVPPVIGFYSRPASIDDMVDFVVGKILDQMAIDHDFYRRWGTEYRE
jgi:4-hydroxy-3-polyprenylbenzoate decarboxylase